MIGKLYFADNFEEIESAQDIGITPPDTILSTKDFYFRCSDVMNFFMTGERDISIKLKGEKSRWVIEYSDSIWDKLTNSFS